MTKLELQSLNTAIRATHRRGVAAPKIQQLVAEYAEGNKIACNIPDGKVGKFLAHLAVL